jgi:O-antigen/teichoic acid export membrane protein
MMSEQIAISVAPETAAAAPLIVGGETQSSFAASVTITFATRLLILVGSMGASIIVGRWLGPDGLGALAVLNVTVALALQFGSAGLPSATTYFIARDRQALGAAWANAIVFALVAGTFMAAAIVILAQNSPGIFRTVSPRLVTIAAISTPFQLLTLLGLNVLLAIDRIRLMNLLDAISSLFILANALTVLVIWRRGLSTLVTFNTAAAVMAALLLVWFVGRSMRTNNVRTRRDAQLLKQMFAYSVKFYVSVVAMVVIFRFDLLMVNHFRGAAEAGVYAVAAQVTFFLIMLPGVIAALLFPRVASRQDQAAAYTLEVTRHAVFVMLIVCIGAAAAAFALPLVYGRGFADATIQLLIMLPGVFFISIESVLVQHFTGTGLPVAIPIFWIITLIANLALNLALIPSLGARAAALNSTLSYGLIFLLVTVYFCRKTGRRPAQIFLLQKHELRDLFARFRRRAVAA